MKICGGGVTNWRESLGPHASCVHQLSLVHARCVRSQAPTANGSRSYFHRRHQDTMKYWDDWVAVKRRFAYKGRHVQRLVLAPEPLVLVSHAPGPAYRFLRLASAISSVR